MTRQRRAHRQFAKPNDVVSPRGRRVEKKRERNDDADDSACASLCTELVLAQRVIHDDVALSRENHNVPGGQETADA